MQNKKLVIFGDSALAEIAYEYFTHDSAYEVVAFTVTQDYLSRTSLFGMPIVPFETVDEAFGPGDHDMFVALSYGRMNRNRERFYGEAKAKGYELASYVSSNAFVWKNVPLGDNVFIFEDNVVQPFVRVGANVILWSGNHIGHHSVILDHCFVASHVVVSGFCSIGRNCFLGVNSTINNNLVIANYNLIGSGCVIAKNTKEGEVFRCPRLKASRVSSTELNF